MAGKPGRRSRAEELGLPRLLEKVVTDSKKLAVMRRLLKIAEEGSDKDSLKAIELLLAYVYGKPTQTVDVSARVVTEYEVVWSEDSGETPEAPSLSDGSEESLSPLQGVVLRSAVGKDKTGLADVPGDSP